MCHVKHMLFLLYILSMPLREHVPSLLFFIIAHVVSLFQRSINNKKKESSFLSLMLADEESMHLFWFLTYILLSWQLKLPVDFMFLVWAFLNTCEWFDFLVMRYPGVPILPLFSGPIEMVMDNCVQIV